MLGRLILFEDDAVAGEEAPGSAPLLNCQNEEGILDHAPRRLLAAN
jgi:hypothetical protein